MGVRIRLKASYDISGFGPVAQSSCALQEVRPHPRGQSGSANFYFQSEDNPNWPDEVNDLKRVPVSAFEAVQP